MEIESEASPAAQSTPQSPPATQSAQQSPPATQTTSQSTPDTRSITNTLFNRSRPKSPVAHTPSPVGNNPSPVPYQNLNYDFKAHEAPSQFSKPNNENFSTD
ncbi:unnamed protein product [Pieris brassicae]|uniref:Uncharacterized protein n=1 Tax=Pieris brassicae TaxID=7116 RepID=A0A9P0TRH0_PIEBR|nr:unnamed protein product [Pieris brassicae]